MVKHIVMWELKDSYSEEEKRDIIAAIKEKLEGLRGKMEGLIELNVYRSIPESSSYELLLDTTFESEEALKAYQVHPEHVKVSQYVGSHVQERKCLDYNVS